MVVYLSSVNIIPMHWLQSHQLSTKGPRPKKKLSHNFIEIVAQRTGQPAGHSIYSSVQSVCKTKRSSVWRITPKTAAPSSCVAHSPRRNYLSHRAVRGSHTHTHTHTNTFIHTSPKHALISFPSLFISVPSTPIPYMHHLYTKCIHKRVACFAYAHLYSSLICHDFPC